MNRYIDIEKLIDALIDIKTDKRIESNVKYKTYNNNGHISVKIGKDKKKALEQICSEKDLTISKLIREIIDKYINFYFGNGKDIKQNIFTA